MYHCAENIVPRQQLRALNLGENQAQRVQYQQRDDLQEQEPRYGQLQTLGQLYAL